MRYADKNSLWKDRVEKEYSLPFLPKLKHSSIEEARYFCLDKCNPVLHKTDTVPDAAIYERSEDWKLDFSHEVNYTHKSHLSLSLRGIYVT